MSKYHTVTSPVLLTPPQLSAFPPPMRKVLLQAVTLEDPRHIHRMSPVVANLAWMPGGKAVMRTETCGTSQVTPGSFMEICCVAYVTKHGDKILKNAVWHPIPWESKHIFSSNPQCVDGNSPRFGYLNDYGSEKYRWICCMHTNTNICNIIYIPYIYTYDL